MSELTRAQRIAAEVYGGGDYDGRWANMAEVEQAEKDGQIGDSLFLFVMRELNDAGNDMDEAVRMMDKASDELAEVAAAIAIADADTADGDDPDYDDDGNLKAGVDHGD